MKVLRRDLANDRTSPRASSARRKRDREREAPEHRRRLPTSGACPTASALFRDGDPRRPDARASHQGRRGHARGARRYDRPQGRSRARRGPRRAGDRPSRSRSRTTSSSLGSRGESPWGVDVASSTSAPRDPRREPRDHARASSSERRTTCRPSRRAASRSTTAADIYALGVIMYEMFTGRVPFEADTYMGVLTQHMFVKPTPPSRLNARARELGALEDVILRHAREEAGERLRVDGRARDRHRAGELVRLRRHAPGRRVVGGRFGPARAPLPDGKPARAGDARGDATRRW